MSDLARQVKYGIGVEATSGTPVSASRWFNQLSFGMKPDNMYKSNESAWGNIVKTNGANIVRKNSTGSLEAKLTPNLGGLILALSMGKVSSVANTDASGNVYDHTIDVADIINSKTATLIRQDSLTTRAYPAARFGKWELSVDLDDYIKYKADVFAKSSSSVSATVAYVDESEFLARHFTIKAATTTGGIAAATNQALVQSFTLSVDPNIEADNEAGNMSSASFTSRGFELGFEMECYYSDTTFEDAYNNGTALAWQMLISDTDTTIGTSAHPQFKFTAPRVTVNEWDRDEGDLDAPVKQNIKGTIHYSPADLYALRAIVTNTLPTLF